MHYAEYDGINSFLVGMSKTLLTEGVKRVTRDQICYEIPNPVMIKIKNPLARIVTIPARHWNHTLPYVESLWLASGRNDMEFVGHYVKKLFEFSDNNITMRAGYGPRFRFFNGIAEDYTVGYPQKRTNIETKETIEVDQFEFIEQSFRKDNYTRQAVISIADPAKDCFSHPHILKKSKDFPCTRSLHFQRNGNALDLTVHMRSNDFIWGATGVNIFNFTFIQEYFAQILGLEIGAYYHVADNLHYYDQFRNIVEAVADESKPQDDYYRYKKSFTTLKEFDERLHAFQEYEMQLRDGETIDIIDFQDDFFNDWANVLFIHNTGNSKAVNFANQVLGKIAKAKTTKKSRVMQKELITNTFSKEQTESDTHFWQSYI